MTNARIQEEEWMITTYPFSEPDPVPALVRNGRIYPYFFFSKLTGKGRNQTWKVVRMENPYVEVFVLPEVGGKVYGAVEKSTKKAFIYLNHVLKFCNIAMRGPWTSGGIEFNFGVVGHTPTCATPVDYVLRENPDGSVSCIVGTIDLPSRTRWSVTITLHKDTAFFETQALWYNPSPLHQSYYSWMNAAVKTGDDLQYLYPGRFAVSHGALPLDPWPVDRQGRDLSWYRNNNFGGSKSHFLLGAYEHHYGGYWHDEHFGFGHWALYDDMPGKKAWIWALSRSGAIWERLLTDTDGQYSEPQAGRHFSQHDHEFFTPYTGDVWREIWFPVKEIGGMVKASPYGAMNVSRDGDTLTIGICPLQELDDDLVVTAGGKEVYREHLTLAPLDAYKETLALPLPSEQGKLLVVVGKKLRYSDDPEETTINRPFHYHAFDETTTEGLYLTGEFLEKQRAFNEATQKYVACLEREPLHTRALTRVAELLCRRGEYERGLDYAHRALHNVMYDPDANYVYGVLARRLGRPVDAKETFGWAARSLKYRSGAYCQIAEISIQEENLPMALEYARRSLDFNTYNLRAYEVLAVIYRKLGDPEQANDVLDRLLTIDPLNHFARFERYLLEPSREALESFRSMIRAELSHEHYLEIAMSYLHLGLKDEAVTVLEQAPAYPTVYYWLAYLLRERSSEQSHVYLQKAEQCSPRFVFPFREEEIPMFQWVVETRPADWRPRYYLSLIYWGKGREEEARQLLNDCGEVSFAPFYIARGHLNRNIDTRRTVCDVEKALTLEEEDWRNWHYLISLYREQQMLDKALAVSEKAYKRFPDETVIALDHVRTLTQHRRYEECQPILETTEVLPAEGATEAHSLFVRVQILSAIERLKKGEYDEAIRYLEKAKTYPEHLGTGMPYHPDFRMQDCLLAFCHAKGNTEEVKKRLHDQNLLGYLDTLTDSVAKATMPEDEVCEDPRLRIQRETVQLLTGSE